MDKNRIVAFQWPRRVDDPKDCEFYHTIELPGLGTQPGHWDLRDRVDDYLGNQKFDGKRVVDVGPASGFLTFEMEKRGASVIAFDFSGEAGGQHDVIPYADFAERFGSNRDDFFRNLLAGLDQMKNSFWYCHHAIGSQARVLYGDIYDPPGPEVFGKIDYAFFGNILVHLQNPLGALAAFASQAREKTIITETMATTNEDGDEPVAYLRAGIGGSDNFGSWWQYTPAFFQQFLGVLGYRHFEVNYHDQLWVQAERTVRHFTIVAQR
jgi:hypothetical protein